MYSANKVFNSTSYCKYLQVPGKAVSSRRKWPASQAAAAIPSHPLKLRLRFTKSSSDCSPYNHFMKESGVYFKGLNGLRFFAAFLVLMMHGEMMRHNYNLFNLQQLTLFSSGNIAVEFFFVLSGFLITYLLLTEHQKTQTISIRHFYWRRVLRIWPLYYIVLILGMGIIPLLSKFLHLDFDQPYPVVGGWLLFAFFLPNLAVSLWGFNFIGPLWSIGVEEQFYFFWAPLMKFFMKYILPIFIAIIAIRFTFYAFTHHERETYEGGSVLIGFLRTLKFEAMATGGLGAWLLFNHREKLMKLKVFSTGIQVLFLVLIILRFTAHKSLIGTDNIAGTVYSALFNQFYSFLLLDMLFLWLILNVSCNPRTIIRTENRVLNFLGNISYGIYMYHTIVLLALIRVLQNVLRPLSPVVSTLLLYIVTGGTTILVAWLSYRLIESRFLRLKHTFAPKGEKAAATPVTAASPVLPD